MRKTFAVVLVALYLSACGGGGDSPTTAPGNDTGPFTLTIRAARSPQGPVIGAAVTMEDYRVFTADGNGAVLFPGSDAGKTVRVTAQGYTGPSVIVLRPVEQKMTHYLLPDDAVMPFSFINEAFYVSRDDVRVLRPMPGRLDVELSAEAWSDPRVSNALAWGAAIVNNAQNHVSFHVVPAGQTGVVKMYSDPADPIFQTPGLENAWAVVFFIRNAQFPYVVVGARIVWRVFLDDTNHGLEGSIGVAMAHELGHVVGIVGHPCCAGIMNGEGSPGSLPVMDFSQREKEAFGYLFMRPQGTRSPDNLAAAPQISAYTAYAQGEQEKEVQVCVLYR